MSSRSRQQDGVKQESGIRVDSRKASLPSTGWPSQFKRGASLSSVRRGLSLLLCLGIVVVTCSVFLWSSASTLQANCARDACLVLHHDENTCRQQPVCTTNTCCSYRPGCQSCCSGGYLNDGCCPIGYGNCQARTILDPPSVHRGESTSTTMTLDAITLDINTSSRLVVAARSLPGRFFVGLISHLGNAAQRDVVRKTWMRHPLVQGGVFTIRFFIALDQSSYYRDRIPATQTEAEAYNDLVTFKGRDDYIGLIWKTIEMLKYFAAHAEQAGWMYFMKMDDTTFPRLGRLYIELVIPFSSKKVCDAGEVYAGWAIDDREPRYMNGPAYAVSRKLAEAILDPQLQLTDTWWRSATPPKQCLDNMYAEDCWMGAWVANVSRSKNMRVTHVGLAARGNNTFKQGCDPHLVFHWDTSFYGMHCMWKEENRRLLSMDKPYADVGNICSNCYTIRKVSPREYGVEKIPEIGPVPSGLFYGCSKVGQGCINPLTRPPGNPSGACGHEYAYDASLGRHEFSVTPTAAGWAMMGRIACAARNDSFAGITVPNFKDCQEACAAISFCTSMEYDSLSGLCRLFAAKVLHPSLGRILRATETFWYLPARSSMFDSPWEKLEMHNSSPSFDARSVAGMQDDKIFVNCLGSSQLGTGELEKRSGIDLSMCKWLCICTQRCTFMVWHSEETQTISSLGVCRTFEAESCAAVTIRRLGSAVALRLNPTSLNVLIARPTDRWTLAQASGAIFVNSTANVNGINAEAEQMILPEPHWRDAGRNHEIEECEMAGWIQDMTTYSPVGFDNFQSYEATIFDCARRCLATVNSSWAPCAVFTYDVKKGECRLHHRGATPAFSSSSVAGGPELSPNHCKKVISNPAEERRSLLMKTQMPYEVPRDGEVLNGCLFPNVPPLYREPLRTSQRVLDGLKSAQISGSRQVLDALSAADPKQLPPIMGKGTRVFYWRCTTQCQGGLDHQMWVLYNLLAIATALHASLAVHPPSDMLTKDHGRPEAAAEWWDSYFTTDPPMRRMKEVQCKRNSYTLSNRDQDEFWRGLSGDLVSKIGNPKAPACFSLNGGWYTLQVYLNTPSASSGTRLTRDLLRMGLERVSFSASREVVELAAHVLARSPQLQQGYGMVHVRRGDKGTPECTSSRHVLDKMQSLGAASGDGFPSSPKVWIVMSNADKGWFEDLRNGARAVGMNIITEQDSPVLANITDNFMLYSVLQHLYGNASRVLYTYKPMRLRPNQADGVFLAQRLCGNADDANVPFLNGGKTLKMNSSIC